MSIDCREIKHSLLDSSLWDELNGSIFVFLASKNEKLFTFFIFTSFYNNYLYIYSRNIKILPLDASGHGKSNKL